MKVETILYIIPFPHALLN